MAAGTRFDVAVVGSGVGGLAAALRAATLGARVVVLEAAKELGGYLAPFRRRAFRFDPGLHYLGACGPGQAFAEALELLGVGDAVRFRELAPDGFDRLVFPGYEVAMPRGAERYKGRLAADFPREARGLDGFFGELAAYREAERAWTATGRGAPWPAYFVDRLRLTFGELLDAYIRDPLLRAVLAAQSGNYALGPKRASALVGLGVLDHYLAGAYFPIGGGGALRDALVAALRARGGVLLRAHAVDRLELHAGRAAGARCENGERFEADAIVSNADGSATYRLVGGRGVPARVRQRAERIRPSLASFCIYLGLPDGAPGEFGEANVWHHPTVDLDGDYDAMLRGELPRGDACFLSSPSAKDAASGPGSTLVLCALLPFGPFARWSGSATRRRGADYEALKGALFAKYAACVERYAPGALARATVVEAATPLTNVSFARAPGGGAYGPEHAPDQMGPRRFAVEGAVPGLFLCGASTTHAGVVACALSGIDAGERAVAYARRLRARALSAPGSS